MTFQYHINEDELRRDIPVIWPAVGELRCLNAKVKGHYRTGIYSGFFDRDHFEELIAALRQIEHASGCYFTPNEVKPELLGRGFNEAKIVTERDCATDKDIARRKWLLVDVDVKRPANISATDEEKLAAWAVAIDVDYYLWEEGFPPGYLGDSGNGSHVMIPVDLPAEDGGYIKGLLATLAKRCDTDRAKVDQSVFNPARIWKLPGTPVCKGSHVPQIGRPWRMSQLVRRCKELPANA